MAMEINWKAEVDKRKEDLLEDLFTLLKIDSVRDDSKATDDAPVGPGPKEALEAFLEIGKRDGFTTKQVGNLAGHIEYVQHESYDQTLGVLGHVDVVPVGTGWNTDPFEPQIIDGKIYARGASDDKGPTVAAYYALKMIKDMGLSLNKRVRLIIGTDEESGWKCMTRYFQTEEMPDFGFSPDAVFPIINGEKGIVSLHLHAKTERENTALYQLVSFEAGLRENMVPQDAIAVLEGDDLVSLQQEFDAFIKQHALKGQATAAGHTLTLEVVGKSAHGSTPEVGVNAATYLATFLASYSFAGSDQRYLAFIAQHLHEDPFASKLSLAYEDAVMGPVTVNPGVFRYADEESTIVLNFRFPRGISADDIEQKVNELARPYGMESQRGKEQTPHYVSPEDPLVSTLLEVYERQTGLKGHEQSIGGGTYGRIFERGVAYGALFPDSVDTMHQANEFLAVEDLLKSTAIYAEAIYELCK